MLNACLTFSWPNNVPFDREAGRLFRPSGLPAAHCTGAGVVGHRGVMIRTKTWYRLELCKRIGRPPSTGLPATSCGIFTNSYTPVECGGILGTDRAITTYRHPLDHGKGMQSPTTIYLGTSPTYIVTTQIPCSPQPYGSTSKGLGHTRRHDEPPSVPISKPQQTYGMNV
jgi:hypothetical protein